MVHCALCGSAARPTIQLQHAWVWRCSAPSCGLQFASPQIDDEELTRAYTACYYPGQDDSISIRYQNTPDVIPRQIFQQLQMSLGSLNGLTMLDYGCGRGSFSRVAQEFGLATIGIEPDLNARRIAASISQMPAYASLSDLREAKNFIQFDLIVLWTVIEHLRLPCAELKELQTLLRPSGLLLVSTMNTGCLRARLERQRWENYENPTHFYYFDRKSLCSVLTAAGYSAVYEWKPKIRYPQHGPFRRCLYNLTSYFGLADGLFFVCSQGEKQLEMGGFNRLRDSNHGLAEVIR